MTAERLLTFVALVWVFFVVLYLALVGVPVGAAELAQMAGVG